MNYQQTPQGLAQMFNSDVSNGGGSIAATPFQMALQGQQQNADQMTQQDQARQLSFDTANDPLKLARSGLDNDTLSAELPGRVAASSTATRNNANADILNDQTVKDAFSKLSSDQINNHVKDIENLGQIALQQAQGANFNPMGAMQRAHQAFIDAGHGDMWNPDWDAANENGNVGDFALKLKEFGTGIQDQAAKLRQNMQIQGAKNEGMYGKAGIQGQNALDLEALKQEGRVALSQLKVSLRPTPQETMSQWEARMRSKPDDPSAQAALQRWEVQKEGIAAAGANVQDAFRRQVIGTPKPAVQVPAGFKDNGDGTYTTPSGAIVKPPSQ